MRIIQTPIGSRGADMASALTAESAAGLKAEGLFFVVRYLGGLSTDELAAILATGLAVGLVTYSRAPGWHPSAAIGATDGAVDVAHLTALGIPKGALVWIDLEGSSGDSAATAAWLTSRAAEIVAAGYVAGVYVGDGCVLNGPELYAVPGVTRYWGAFNRGIPEPQCGFCQRQLYPPNQVLAGVEIDYDTPSGDYEGRTPSVLAS